MTTIAQNIYNTSTDSFGRGFPTMQELIAFDGCIIDKSEWYGMYPPYITWEFPDNSCLTISGDSHKVMQYH